MMSLQKKGKVHHAVLVEQVRGTCSDIFFHIVDAICLFKHDIYHIIFFILAFQLRHSRQRDVAVLHPNANWQRHSVWKEVSTDTMITWWQVHPFKKELLFIYLFLF